jgi:hypothetical protein
VKRRNKLALAIGVTVASVYLMELSSYSCRDKPLPGLIDFIALRDGTVYSDGFTETRFRNVRLGMKKNELLNLIGLPLSVNVFYHDRRDPVRYSGASLVRALELIGNAELPINIKHIVCYYSRQGSHTSDWNVRAITLSNRGAVIDISSSFYFD